MIAPIRPLHRFLLQAPLSGGTLFAGWAEREIEAWLEKIIRTREFSHLR